MNVYSLYVDGGTIGKNPSLLGGTWCYCWADKDSSIIYYNSGIITPKQAKTAVITNNFSELYAFCQGIYSLSEDWSGTVYTDSTVTLSRITTGNKFKNIPLWLKNRVRQARNRRWQAKLVGGHPDIFELVKGTNTKGIHVSRCHVFCDQICTELADDFKTGRKSTVKSS